MITVTSPEEFERGLFGDKSVAGPSRRVQPGALNGAFILYKEWGQTPLETMEAYRQMLLTKCQTEDSWRSIADVPMTYAGRLDPVAEGSLIVLTGEETKHKDQYLWLDKEYEIEVLLGLGTDSGDIFGVLERIESNQVDAQAIDNTKIQEVVLSFRGKHTFPYPAYSSKTVQGKPLFQWKNEGKICEIEIPTKDVEIYDIELHKVNEISIKEISKKIEDALEKVHGDFRFEKIKESWNFTDGKFSEKYKVLHIRCQCSSGTYMRVLANEIGKKLSVPALAYHIKRTKFIF